MAMCYRGVGVGVGGHKGGFARAPRRPPRPRPLGQRGFGRRFQRLRLCLCCLRRHLCRRAGGCMGVCGGCGGGALEEANEVEAEVASFLHAGRRIGHVAAVVVLH